ncbi:hypothetical protein JCM18897A_25920 [Streptomyces sp. JCM 18897]
MMCLSVRGTGPDVVPGLGWVSVHLPLRMGLPASFHPSGPTPARPVRAPSRHPVARAAPGVHAGRGGAGRSAAGADRVAGDRRRTKGEGRSGRCGGTVLSAL